MKKNVFLTRDLYFASLVPKDLRRAPVLVSLAAYAISLALIIGGQGYLSFSVTENGEFEVGRVAERDIIANQAVSYIDEVATREKIDALERQTPAVFSYSAEATEGILVSYGRFVALAEELLDSAETAEAFRDAVEEQFPGAFPGEIIAALYEDPDRGQFPAYGLQTLRYIILEEGIFSLPETGLETFNPQIAELRHNYGPRTERENVAYTHVITLDKAGTAIEHYIAQAGFRPGFARLGPALLDPFITENVFYSREDTERLVAELRGRTEPVMGSVERGDVVVRKGFIVTERDMTVLNALNAQARGGDPRLLIGRILIFTLVYGFMLFFMGRRIIGRLLKPSEVYLLCVLAVVYTGAAVFFKSLNITEYPAAIFLPTSLMIMLPAILINLRASFAVAIALPLVAFLSGAFDSASYILALTSSIAAAYAVREAERRMDLFKAGLVIAAIQCVASTAILLIQSQPLVNYPPVLFWTAFNGLASGMMVLGFLPILEHALNSVTTFRLIELSDLNAPAFKRLFSVAPGTYTHSLMVATLAENACQEIGANPLLARVGAYYHDIGKMDNPNYFVENQTDYNKHDDINNPRLSATVIRSHVKLGVEKARSLGLPKEVIDIIAEHHGNSVISWFYNEALKREIQVDVEDFSYPGTPPRSKESAVVMLADTTEAACRTLKKPTASRLEKFIQELIMAKFEHGQLSASELTFIDLETIKNSFVRVLASQYHARIEYPKKEPQPNASSPEDAPQDPGGGE
ncbi:MAG: HDIG domain-containing protein [Treponema sp.]|jgi:putative nucleotidyltransferase with HDIG domain|nr:HDIG domain-containing protein [Treponema sp.]